MLLLLKIKLKQVENPIINIKFKLYNEVYK